MITDIDIYRSAAVFIREHGEDAALEAGIHADRLLAKGDIAGQRTWLRIVRAISQLQKVRTEGEDLLH